MIKGTDIRRFVVNKLNESFFDIDVLNPNVEEDYLKDVFFIYIDNLTWQSHSNGMNLYNYEIQIQYQEKGDIELMEMGEILCAIFNGTMPIEVIEDGKLISKKHVLVNSGTAEIIQKNLFYIFNIIFTAPKVKKLSERELMMRLHVNTDEKFELIKGRNE